MTDGDMMRSIKSPGHCPWIWILGFSPWSHDDPQTRNYSGPFANFFRKMDNPFQSLFQLPLLIYA